MSTLESVRWNELHQNPSKNQKKVDMILNDQHKIREQSNAMTILNAFCSLRRCAKEPFVDFATTRNRVLQIAGQRAEYQGWRVHLQLLPPMLMKLNIFEFDGLFCILSFWKFPQYVSIPHKSCSLSLWSFRGTRFILMLSGDETLHQGHHLRRFITQHAGFCGGSEDHRSCNVWGFERAQNKSYIMMSRGYTYSHSNVLVFEYLT